MSTKLKLVMIGLLVAIGVLVSAVLLASNRTVVLNPQGTIAAQQRDLMLFASLLSLIVIIPVFAMTIFIGWKYRASNKKARYSPDWAHSRVAETVWWGVPVILITVLAVITWHTTHSLDPYKPIASDKKALEVQVIALDWKWLFIYPEYNIASVNYVALPEQTPVNFSITSDAPMNSFWIPSLGGQVYAMAGMTTKLHLMADKPGTYQGASANLSGKGFASMKFTAHSMTEPDFTAWVRSVQHAPDTLTLERYKELAKPTEKHPQTFFALKEPGLYDTVVMKYMVPPARTDDHHEHESASSSHDAGHHAGGH